MHDFFATPLQSNGLTAIPKTTRVGKMCLQACHFLDGVKHREGMAKQREREKKCQKGNTQEEIFKKLIIFGTPTTILERQIGKKHKN